MMVEFRSQVIEYCHFGLVLNQIHRPKALVFDLMRLSNHLSFSKKTAQCCFESLTPTLPCFSLPLLQAEIGPAALNLTDTPAGTGGSVGGSSSPTGNAGKAPAPPVGSASSPPAAAAPGGRRPASPASPAPKSPSKASPGRGKGTWRVEDLEGELERKIKMLEKERQAMRKETQGQHEKINQGIDTVSHRVTELEHSEYPGGR